MADPLSDASLDRLERYVEDGYHGSGLTQDHGRVMIAEIRRHRAKITELEAERDRLMEVIKRAYRAAAARDIEGVLDALLEAVESPAK